MLTPIGKITRELKIETHQLREWEKRDWLGDVLKDPHNNYQRVYNEQQLKRIQLIHETIKAQREKGFKRTNFTEVEEKLLEVFGGEVIKRNTEIIIHPGSMEQMVELMTLQQKMIAELQEKVQSLQLPAPIDYTEHFEEIKIQAKFREEREEKLLQLVKKMQDDIEELKKMPPKSRWKFWS